MFSLGLLRLRGWGGLQESPTYSLVKPVSFIPWLPIPRNPTNLLPNIPQYRLPKPENIRSIQGLSRHDTIGAPVISMYFQACIVWPPTWKSRGDATDMMEWCCNPSPLYYCKAKPTYPETVPQLWKLWKCPKRVSRNYENYENVET